MDDRRVTAVHHGSPSGVSGGATLPSPRTVWLDRGAMVALFATALWIRWQFVPSPTYGDEGQHWFHSANLLARRAPNVADPYGATWFHPWWAMLQRPVWYLFYAPFAEHGFATMRIAHAGVTSLLPAVGYGWLRSRGTPSSVAMVGAALVAFHPVVATFSTLLLMDADMTLLFVGGLWARQVQRPVLAAILLLAAVWTKEIAFFGVAALFVWEMLHTPRPRWWPMRPTKMATALLAPLVIGLAPVMVSLSQGLQPPGGPREPDILAVLESSTASAWLIVPLVVGLAFARVRLAAAAALFFTALLMGLSAAGRAVEIWYTVPAVTLTLLAVPACAHEFWQVARQRWRPRALAAGAAAASFVAIAVFVIVVPMAAQPALARPLTSEPQHSLAEAIQWETNQRDAAFVHAMRTMQLNGSQNVTTVDVFYPLVLHPIAKDARYVTTIYPFYPYFFNGTWQPHIDAIAAADWLLVGVVDWPLHHAIDASYAACRVLDEEPYRLYDLGSCKGRGESLYATFRQYAAETGYQVA